LPRSDSISNGCRRAWRGSLSDRVLIAENRCAACQIARTHLHRCRTFVPAQMCTRGSQPSTLNPLTIKIGPTYFSTGSLSMAREGVCPSWGVGSRSPAAWSAREIESQALATLAALAQISTPSAAHFLKSHQLLVQKFAADRDRQKGPSDGARQCLSAGFQLLALIAAMYSTWRMFARRRLPAWK
jgi:hypothetical protein